MTLGVPAGVGKGAEIELDQWQHGFNLVHRGEVKESDRRSLRVLGLISSDCKPGSLSWLCASAISLIGPIPEILLGAFR
jgi:hypothetical protein